jgi:hypothetical protein
MKNKIKEALQQTYKNTGVGEKAFEGVATFATTYVKEESEIENFVKGAEPLLKAMQGEQDRLRGSYSTEINSLKEQLAKYNNPEPPKGDKDNDDEPKPAGNDFAELLAAIKDGNKANSDLIAEMRNELNTYKQKETAKETRTAAQAMFKADPFAKMYTELADEAWDRAIEIYDLQGAKMSAQELNDKAMGYLKKSATKKGIDVSKPIDGDGADKGPDFSKMAARQRNAGNLPPESK